MTAEAVSRIARADNLHDVIESAIERTDGEVMERTVNGLTYHGELVINWGGMRYLVMTHVIGRNDELPTGEDLRGGVRKRQP